MTPISGCLVRSEEPCVANHFVLVELVAPQTFLQCIAVGHKFLFSFSSLKVSE